MIILILRTNVVLRSREGFRSLPVIMTEQVHQGPKTEVWLTRAESQELKSLISMSSRTSPVEETLKEENMKALSSLIPLLGLLT